MYTKDIGIGGSKSFNNFTKLVNKHLVLLGLGVVFLGGVHVIIQNNINNTAIDELSLKTLVVPKNQETDIVDRELADNINLLKNDIYKNEMLVYQTRIKLLKEKKEKEASPWKLVSDINNHATYDELQKNLNNLEYSKRLAYNKYRLLKQNYYNKYLESHQDVAAEIYTINDKINNNNESLKPWVELKTESKSLLDKLSSVLETAEDARNYNHLHAFSDSSAIKWASRSRNEDLEQELKSVTNDLKKFNQSINDKTTFSSKAISEIDLNMDFNFFLLITNWDSHDIVIDNLEKTINLIKLLDNEINKKIQPFTVVSIELNKSKMDINNGIYKDFNRMLPYSIKSINTRDRDNEKEIEKYIGYRY